MKRSYWHPLILVLLIAVACLFGDRASAALWEHLPWAAPSGAVLALLVNATSLQALFSNLKATFNKAFDAAPSLWQNTTMLVPSGTKTENYAWLSTFPKMRKWLGDKVVKALAAHKYSLTNDDYEATIEVDRNDIEDDTLGIYGPQAQDAGMSAKQWPDEMDAELKDGAFAGTCYDGQYFYDTDHPGVGADGKPTTFSNKGTAALSNATQAAAAASYGAARIAIMSFRDDQGRPLALIPDTLEVGPTLETVANMLMNNDKLADESPNPYKGQCKVIVNPRLTSTTQWMLHVTTRPLKPFIFQQRKAPVFVSQTDMNADDVFNRKKFKFGAEARGVGGYGLWQLSYGSTGLG